MQTTATDPNRFAQDLFRPLPRRYDRLEELLSFGQNGRWRREMIEHIGDGDPRAILDVATGTDGPRPSAAGPVPHGQVTVTDLAGRRLARVTRQVPVATAPPSTDGPVRAAAEPSGTERDLPSWSSRPAAAAACLGRRHVSGADPSPRRVGAARPLAHRWAP